MRNPACLSNFCLHIVSLTQVQSLHPAVGTLSQLCASLLVYAAVAFIYYRVLKWITVLLGGFHPILVILLHPWTPIRFPADWSMCYIASDSPNSSTGSSINAPCLSPLYRWSLLRKEVLKSRWWSLVQFVCMRYLQPLSLTLFLPECHRIYSRRECAFLAILPPITPCSLPTLSYCHLH